MKPTIYEVAFRADANANCVCGNCDFVLTKGVTPKQLDSIVIRCPACGAYNDSY